MTMQFLSRLWSGTQPTILGASGRDTVQFSELHARSFGRGWSESEFEALLADRNVVTHKAALPGNRLAGFIVSRIAADEAEILSVAVARSYRGRGVGGRLLDFHLGILAGLGIRMVFLEVEADNAAAIRLYAARHFREVGQRKGYYARASGDPATARVLRRDLV